LKEADFAKAADYALDVSTIGLSALERKNVRGVYLGPFPTTIKEYLIIRILHESEDRWGR
jgi:hypothetical protein